MATVPIRTRSSDRLTPALRARRFYAAERYLARLIAGEPRLTDDQRDALVALLIGGQR